MKRKNSKSSVKRVILRKPIWKTNPADKIVNQILPHYDMIKAIVAEAAYDAIVYGSATIKLKYNKKAMGFDAEVKYK